MDKQSPWLTLQYRIRLLAPAAAAAAQQDHHHHQPPSASSIQPQLSSTPTLPPPPAPTLPVKSSRLRSLALWNSANVTIAKRNALAGDEHSKPEIEGWLYKRSDKYRTWNKRWFILKGSTLFYLKSPKVCTCTCACMHIIMFIHSFNVYLGSGNERIVKLGGVSDISG